MARRISLVGYLHFLVHEIKEMILFVWFQRGFPNICPAMISYSPRHSLVAILNRLSMIEIKLRRLLSVFRYQVCEAT